MEVKGAGPGCRRVGRKVAGEGCKDGWVDGVQGEGKKVLRERMELEKWCCEPK